MLKYLAASAVLLATLLAPTSEAMARDRLAVDENEFLKRSFDFTPPEEKELEDRWLKQPVKPFPFADSKIVTEKGVTSVVVNGERLPNWSRSIGATFTPGSPVERRFREVGMRLYIIDVGLTVERYTERLLENAPDEAFEKFKRSADNLLAQVPDAVIIIRPWMISVSKDYAEQYPDGLLAGPDGETDWGGEKVGGHTTRPNMLNEWKRYCGEHLHRFIHRLGESPYAPKIAGFYLAAMNSGEWWYYKGKGDPGWDYSKTRKEAFIRFVRHKYGDNEAIAKAWGVPNNEQLLDLPSLKERSRFPVPPNSKVSDYMQVLNLPVSNAAQYFAKIIKAATNGKSLAGMEIHMGGITYPVNGTVMMNHLLDAPEIDFFGGPSGYGDRGPGSTPHYRVVIASLARHGKLWLNEGDYRTPLAYDTVGGAQGEPPPDMEGMKQVFRREFARGVAFDYPTYLMDFGWAWFLDPNITKQVKEVVQAEAVVAQRGVKRNAEVAVVTDQESQYYANYFASPTLMMLEGALDRIGAAWDFYEMRDFLEGDRYRQYKTVIFLNTCALAEGERKKIDQIKGDNRTLLWMHRPGTTDLSFRNGVPAELASALTGMEISVGYPIGKVKLADGAFSQKADLAASTLNRDEESRTRLNIEVSLSDAAEGQLIGNQPSDLFVSDPKAKPLVVDEKGRAYVAVRKHPDWTAVYTAFCEMEPWMLRRIIKDAGCHLWVETDDVSYVAENFFSIHAASAGKKQIHLPEKFSGLYEIFTGRELQAKDGVVEVAVKEGDTLAFFAGEVDREALTDAVEKLEAANRAFLANHPSGPMYAEFERRYAPAAPAQSGNLPLIRWGHSSQPEVILAAGPFASDKDSVAAVDSYLADLKLVDECRFRNISTQMGSSSADFMIVTKPFPLLDAAAGLGEWTAWATTFPWNSSHRLGFVDGQTYAGAVFLEAPQATEAQLHFYTQGDARLWVEGKEVQPNALGHFHHPLTVGSTRHKVVFRIKGDSGTTGFAIRLTAKAAADTKGIVLPWAKETVPVAETVTQWIPEPKAETAEESH